MTQTSAALLRSAYDNFAAGDVPAVLAVFSEDIAWHISGRNPLSGVYSGHDEVLGFFQALGERSDGTFALDLHDILADEGGDAVAVVVTERARRNGAQLEVGSVHLWSVEDGKATRFQALMADEYATDAFWS